MRRIGLAAWYGGALVLVATAVLTTALRLGLPALGAQRPLIEARISEHLGHRVSIGHLTASWRGALPSLTARDIRILGSDGTTPVLRFARARGDIAPLASLAARELTMKRIVLEGLELTVVRERDGRIAIAGLKTGDTRFRDWLLEQAELSVTDADVAFIDRLREAPVQVFRGVTLSSDRGADGPRIRGHVEHVGILDAPLDFELALERADGAALEPARLVLASRGLDIAPAATHFAAQPWAGPAGRADLALWLQWRDRTLARVAFDAETTRLRWAAGEKRGIERLRLDGVASRGAGDTWQLALGTLDLTTAAGVASASGVRAEIAGSGPERTIRATASRVPAAALRFIDAVLPAEAGALRGFVHEASPLGELHDARLGWRPGATPQLFLAARLRHGGLEASAHTPAIDGLDAHFALNRRHGAIGFRRAAFTVGSDRLAKALAVRELTGRARWDRDAAGWRLASPGLTGTVDDFPIRLAGHARLTDGELPRVGLDLEVGAGALSQLHFFMPKGVMSPKGDHWLRQAFVSGRLDGARLALHGPLAAFPFDAGGGLFTADFVVSDVELAYSEKWPHARALDGHIALAGRRLAGLITAGRFFDSPLERVTLEMEDVFTRKPAIAIAGEARATFADALRVIRESPLAAGPARQLSDLEVAGELGLALDMNLGLTAGASRTVLGTIELAGNRLHSPRHGVTLEHLQGTLSFTREDWYGEDLTALYEGQRVGLVVNGGIGDPNYDSVFRMTGTADAAQLTRYLERYVPRVHGWLADAGQLGSLEGSLPWKAVLTIPHASDATAGTARQLVLESSLEGLSVGLPWPLGKAAAEAAPLRIETSFGSALPRTTRVRYGEALALAVRQGAPDNGGRPLQGIDVALGAGTALEPVREAIRVHGRVETLPLGEWTPLVGQGRGAPAAARSLPIEIDLAVGQLEVLGQPFTALTVRGHRDPLAWRFDVAGERVAGEVTVPHDMDAFPLTMNLDRLWLAPVERDGERRATPPDPRRIPPIVIACTSFKYGDVDLGQVALATERVGDGLRLPTIVFNTPAFQVNATGSWRVLGEAHRSEFDIRLTGAELAAVLGTFGYDAQAIEGGRTALDIQAAWAGTPAQFTLSRLDGRLMLKVEKGRFLDIEPGGGRLFGLLSLQALPRRLSLDFADLFRKGFAFDSIEGWFELERGNAYTNSLVMEGPSARVEISGRTGLAAHDYDQQAIVTPALSNSIPLASALFGPAGIGVGAAIYLGQKVFKSIPEQVDRFLRRQYSITGSWQDPVVEKL